MALMMQHHQNLTSIDSPSLQSYHQDTLSDDNDEDFIISNVSTKVYERSRIKALADEREGVQKKTFTKWINSQIEPLGLRVTDLYMDLRDGKFLLTLLEVLSHDAVPKPTRGRMRIHCLENVDKCLGFLYDQKVHLENVGAHDIVDGNSRLTLGLVWTMILRFQLQDIRLDYYYNEDEEDVYNDETAVKQVEQEEIITKDTVDTVNAVRETNKFKSKQKKTVSMRSNDNAEAQSAKDALLLWCQIKTAGYPGVNIRNFTTSWRTGLGFCALIHKHRPDLIDYTAALKQSNPANLLCAFQTAENKLGIAPLLDPEDVDVNQPDSKSVITYLASYYHYFNSHKTSSVLNKRLNRLLAQALDDENMERLYTDLATSLLEWIKKKVEELDDRSALTGAGLEDVKDLLAEFSAYRTQEKPPKFKEKAEIEVLLFSLKRRCRPQREEVVTLASRLDSAWDGHLNKSEHTREQALYTELRRHERLALDAQRFRKRAALRQGWITVNLDLLTHQAPGSDHASTLAALKKHEAFETDIYAYESNLDALGRLAEHLEREGYQDAKSIVAEKQRVMDAWNRLLDTLNQHRERLDNLLQLHSMLREYSEVQFAIDAVRARLESPDLGKHLLGVEELLRAHELLDSDIQALDQRLDKVVAESNRYLKYSEKDFKGNNKNNGLVIDKKREVLTQYDDLLAAAERRKEALLHSQQVFQYLGEIESEQQWMREVLRILRSTDNTTVLAAQDLAAIDRTLKKHKQLEGEIENRRVRLEERLMEGKALTEESNVGADRIKTKNEEVLQMWEELVESAEQKKVQLVGDMEVMQVLADCEELSAWIEEMNRLFDDSADPESERDVERDIQKNQENMTLIQNKRQNIEELRAQATQLLDLLDDDAARRQSVMQTVKGVENEFEKLVKRVQNLQEKLLDRLSVQRLLNDADSVRTWIIEKEKFLVNFVPTDDIEELEVMKLRFETFEAELTKRAEKVYHVNTLSENFAAADTQSSDNFKVIVDNQDELNTKWNKMADVVDQKREELLSKYHYEHFCVDCKQTVEWIEEKTNVVQALERSDQMQNENNDGGLEAILQVQRRLDHVERDMCAIEAKINYVDSQGEMLLRSGLGNLLHPIESKLDEVHQAWRLLQDCVKAVSSKLEGKGGVHKIVIELETMRDWIEEASGEMARSDTPENLEQAEKLMVEFNILRSEISNREDLVNELIQTGMDYLTKDDVSGVEAGQIGQRVDALQKSWHTLHSLTEEKEHLLDQYCKGLVFFDAANEFEKTMNQHENFLNKDLHSSNLIGLHEAVNDQSEFVDRIENDHALLQDVLDRGAALLVEDHFQSDKVKAKCKNIEERWNRNLEKAKNRKDDIQETLKLQELLQDIEDLDDNLLDKINVVSQISAYNASKSKTASFAQCKSIEEETKPLQQSIDQLHERAQEVAIQLPRYEKEIQTGLDNLDSSWQELNALIEEKLNSFSEMDKEQVFEESTKSIMDFLSNLESQLIPDEDDVLNEAERDREGDVKGMRTGVRAVEEKRKKFQDKEGELELKRQMLEQLEQSKNELQRNNPERAQHFEEVQQQVRVGLNNMCAPLANKRQVAETLRIGEEMLQSLDEEDDWVDEKLALLAVKDRDLNKSVTADNGTASLCRMTVQGSRALQRWLGEFRKEVDNRHKSDRLKTLYKRSESMISNNHPKTKQIQRATTELQEKWLLLLKALNEFDARLKNEVQVQEYLMNVSEACAWISEKELHLTAIKLDKKIKDEAQVRRAARKHSVLDKEIEEYKPTIKDLRKQKEAFTENKDMLEQVQRDLEHNYLSLKALSEEKKIELDVSRDYCKVFELYQSLEAWIAAKTKIARNDKVGRDLDECNFLRSQFSEFSVDTNKVGAAKLEQAWQLMDSLIKSTGGTGDVAYMVATWKDRINEMWADLLELIDTRIQLLKAAWDRHKWICDCQFLLDVIDEKREHLLSLNMLGTDSKSVLILHRKLTNFEADLTRLNKDITQASDSLEPLLPLYSQAHRDELIQHREHLQEEYRKLRQLLEKHSVNNLGLADFYKFTAMIKELLQWIDSVITKMNLPNTQNKPRDVSGVELLLSSHRSLKSEIDSKDENFSVTLNLGRTLLRSKHPESATIKAQCKEVNSHREAMCTRWYGVLDQLSLMVEVYQWARDAAVAESWLIGQENQLESATQLLTDHQQQQTEDSLDQTMALLKRLVLLQKNAQNQEEKFEQLKRLTTLEIRASHLNQNQNIDTMHSREGYAGLDVGHSSLFPAASSSRSILPRSGSIDSNLDLVMTADESSYSQQQAQKGALALTTKARPQPSGAKRLDVASHPDIAARSNSPRPQVSSRRTPSPSLSSSSRHTATNRPAPSHRQQPSTSGGVAMTGQSMTHLATTLATPTTKQGVKPQDICMQGPLYRKHQWNNKGQKASNRSWKSLYVEILNCRLYFFKDERHYRERPGQFYRHEMPLSLSDVVAAPASDYIKRPCVFRVRVRSQGTEFLFQAGSIIEMTRWVEALNAAAGSIVTTSNTGSKTLPAASSDIKSQPDLRRAESTGAVTSRNTNNSSSGLKRFFSSIRLKK